MIETPLQILVLSSGMEKKGGIFKDYSFKVAYYYKRQSGLLSTGRYRTTPFPY